MIDEKLHDAIVMEAAAQATIADPTICAVVVVFVDRDETGGFYARSQALVRPDTNRDEVLPQMRESLFKLTGGKKGPKQ